MDKKVLVIGLGKMGLAISRMLNKAGYDVYGYDKAEVRLAASMNHITDLNLLWQTQAPVIIAVKPNQLSEVLSKIPDNRLVMSIAAGVSVAKLQAMRAVAGPVIRVMPNTPLIVKEGISALYSSSDTTAIHRDFALELFMHGGDAFFLDKENDMHAVTALSGSGPAFVELFMQAMEDAGVQQGLTRDTARRLATATTLGAARLVKSTKRSPQEHIHDVTSPGGTTIAGLAVLKDFSMERAVMRAVKKSAERSRELGDD